jgi:16S rRNA C1402 (ribose-2'-O) methylase RsmI
MMQIYKNENTVLSRLQNLSELARSRVIYQSKYVIRRCLIAIYATCCKMSVFFALDMTIGPRVSTNGPTCRVQKNSHFATCFIQDFFLI